MGEKEEIKAYYATDLINNGTDFDQQISLWMKYWALEQNKDINSLSKTIKYISDNSLEVMFPNIMKAVSILLTILATSVSVEKANFALRFIKLTTGAQCQRIALMHLFCHMYIGT